MCVLPTKLQSHSCKIILTRSKNMCERQREQEAVKRRGNEARDGEEDVEEEEKKKREGREMGKKFFKIRGLLIKELWNLLESEI